MNAGARMPDSRIKLLRDVIFTVNIYENRGWVWEQDRNYMKEQKN